MSQNIKAYIVPINVETMRIGYSDDISNKFKWPEYYFEDMTPYQNKPASIATGPDVMQPLVGSKSGINPVIDSNINGEAAGVRLHWALPDAVVKGNIGRDKNEPHALKFPVLPNRWLITAYYEDKKNNNQKSYKQWIVESDALSTDKPKEWPAIVVPNPAVLPNNGTPESPVPLWEEKKSTPPGFQQQRQYLGKVVSSIENWTDPGSTNALDAVSYYGPTFTAYYMNGATFCGFFDDLKPQFDPSSADISVSYQIIGWYSDMKDDIVSQTFKEASTTYPVGSSNRLENIPAFIRKRLKWEFLAEYENPPYQFEDMPDDCRSIFNGMAMNISFSKPKYLDKTYNADDISIAVGNNISEAVSSLLVNNTAFPIGTKAPDKPEKGAPYPTLETKKDLEYLLNAFQGDILRRLNSGNAAHRIEKVETMLHNRRFGTYPGGTTWTVRAKATVGEKQTSDGATEAVLPLIAAKALNRLNTAQSEYDANIRQIETARQQLFMDWLNNAYLFNENTTKSSANYDIPDDYASLLMAEITEWFVLQAETGKLNIEDPSAEDSGSVNTTSAVTFTPRLTVPNTTVESYLFATGNAIEKLLGGQDVHTQPIGLTEAKLILDLLTPTITQKISQLLVSNTVPELMLQELHCYANILKNISSVFQSGSITSLLNTLKSKLVNQQKALTNITTKYAQYADTMSTGSTSISDFYNTLTGSGELLYGSDIKAVLSQTQYNGVYDIQDAIVCLEYFESAFSTDIITTDGAYGYVVKGWDKAVKAKATVTDLIARCESLQQSINSEEILQKVGQYLDTITSKIAALIQAPTPNNIGALLAALQVPNTLNSEMATLSEYLEKLYEEWIVCLPIGHQVVAATKVMNLVMQAMMKDLLLQQKKAPPFHFPNEPVLALSEQNQSGNTSMLRRVNRNGLSTNLPCREATDLITVLKNEDGNPITVPTFNLPESLKNDSIFTSLLKEGAMLAPENGAASVPLINDYKQAQFGASVPPIWQSQTKDGICFKGKLPYYIGLNVVGSDNAFLPLFIAWESNFTSLATVAEGNAPTTVFPEDTITNNFHFEGSDLKPSREIKMNTEGITYTGQMFLTDSGNVSLIHQLQTFLKNRLNFDPKNPPPPDKRTPLESELYETWLYFKNETVLAQGFSGFNAALLERIQNYQFPFNYSGTKKNLTDATGLLAAFTQMWDQDNPNWRSYNPIANNGNIVSKSSLFLPLRAGAMRINKLTIVDVFGRFIDIVDISNKLSPKINIAKSLKFSDKHYMGDSPNLIYLSPRIVQPNRLRVLWESADTKTQASFLEYNPHPAYSPICGWIMENRIDDSLFAYETAGNTLGYFDTSASSSPWRSTPMSDGGGDNILSNDIKTANPTFQDFISKFLGKLTGGQAGTFATLSQAVRNTNQFLPASSANRSLSMAAIKGRPLMLAKVRVSLEIYGEKAVAINAQSLSNPSKSSTDNDLKLDAKNFAKLTVTKNPTTVPDQFPSYNQLKRNTAGVEQVDIPVTLGNNNYLTDGLIGFFKWDDQLKDYDYTTFHAVSDIPEQSANGITIKKAAPILLNLEKQPYQSLLVLADPSVPIHAISGVLPEQSIQVPSDEYQRAIDNLKVYLNVNPILLNSQHKNGQSSLKYEFPVPKENGYKWSWVQPSLTQDQALEINQSNDKAHWNNSPMELQDGWLKMEEKET